MTKKKILEEVNAGLMEILRDSFKYCESDDSELSSCSVRINNKAHELKVLLERFNSCKED